MQVNTTTAISTNTTTDISTGNTIIYSICLPKTSAGTITFNDRAGSPNTYFVLPAATVAGTYKLKSVFGNGLSIITASADNVLVSWRQG